MTHDPMILIHFGNAPTLSITSGSILLRALDAKEAEIRIYVPRPHAFEEGQDLGTVQVAGWDDLRRPIFDTTVVSVTSDGSNPRYTTGADYVVIKGIPAPVCKRVDWKPESVGVEAHRDSLVDKVAEAPMNDQLVERVARTLHNNGCDPTASELGWAELYEGERDQYMSWARAALGAIRETHHIVRRKCED